MTEGSLPENPEEAPSTTYRRLFELTAEALRRGEAPRGKLKLLEATRYFRKAGQPTEQLTGLLLLAEVEERAADLEAALKRAKSAMRLAQSVPSAEGLVKSRLILARVHSRNGSHGAALEHGRQAAELAAAVDAECHWDSLARLAATALKASEIPEALGVAERASRIARAANGDARQQLARSSEWIWAELLLRSGLPLAAEEVSRKAMRTTDDPALELEFAFTRGSARLVLGAGGRALRDFRRVSKTAKANGNLRLEAEALAAEGVVRALVTNGGSDDETGRNGSGKSTDPATLLARAERRARQLKQPAVKANVSGWAGLLNGGRPKSADRTAVADQLVLLARDTTLEEVVDACFQEVQRLSGLPDGAPAYVVSPDALPLRLPE